MSNAPQNCWGVIPAAGSGSRMGGAMPKQYLTVHGKTVLEHSLSSLLGCPSISAVVVAVQADDKRPAAMACFADARVQIAVGGATRSESVLSALSVIARQAMPDDWVLVHDAARPCVSAGQVCELVRRVQTSGRAGILAQPIVDTVKQASSNGEVRQTLDRNNLWRAQTPQMFRLSQLREALIAAIASGDTVTDEASAMELAGHAVKLYHGSASNLKVTVPEDLRLAEFYLQREGS